MIEPRQTQSVSIGDEPIIDVKAAGYFLGYLRRSTQRRRKTMVTTFFLTLAGVGILCIALPRDYKITTRILTHKSLVMTALVHPDRAIPQAADAPTSGAVELIKSRENLENLMNDIKLQDAWESKRSVLSKFKDKMFLLVGGKPTQSDIHEAYLKMLDERITPSVENEVVVMNVQWPDPDIAMNLAEGAVARFLKLRRDMELSEILETVTILERNVENSRVGIEGVVARMQKTFNEREAELQARRGSKKPKKNRFIAIRKPVGAQQIDPAVEDLKKSLNEKQAAVSTLKRNFENRIKKAESDLANLRASLGPDHPDVAEAKRALESVSQPPAELMALQAEEARLASQLSTMPAASKPEDAKAQKGAKDDRKQDPFDTMRVPVSEELFQQIDADPEIVSIMSELKKREDGHDDLLRRLANARIESETANVAFEYRYIMTAPPVYPKKAVKPNIPLLMGGGAVLALTLGVLFAVASDILSRRILEPWQVERFLDVKVLGEIDEP